MPFGHSKGNACLECGFFFDHNKKLSNHIKKEHGLTPQEYTCKHFYSGSQPICAVIGCNNPTRYVSLGEYKRYCKQHANLAMINGGSKGGRAEAWNLGLTKKTDTRVARLAEKLSGHLNPFFGHTHTTHAKNKISLRKRLKFQFVRDEIARIHPDISIISSESDYHTQHSLLTVVCNKCNVQSNVSFFNLQRCWTCRNCNPIASRPQIEIYDIVKSFESEVDISNRGVIAPLELDIWCPNKLVAIEYHGLFWHSGGKSKIVEKTLHQKKSDLCREKSIRLLQFFSDDWRDKKEICVSMIKNALGLSIKLNARDCNVVNVTARETKNFLNETHISGYVKATHHFVLQHPSEGIVAAATFRKPIQKKYGNVIELARLSFKKHTAVRGGASKLLAAAQNYFANRFDGILSYADLMFGHGAVYEKCGFSLLGKTTSLNYWYTDGQNRFDRFKYRAQNGMSEKEYADSCGVRIVYGAGNYVFIKRWR